MWWLQKLLRRPTGLFVLIQTYQKQIKPPGIVESLEDARGIHSAFIPHCRGFTFSGLSGFIRKMGITKCLPLGLTQTLIK
jgi:hypothetical protein